MTGVKSKVIIFNAIVLVISLVVIAILFSFLQQEKARSLAFKKDLEIERANLKTTLTELENVKNEIMRLEEDLSQAQLKISTLTRDLENEKRAKEDALVQINQLNSGLEEMRALKADLENEVSNSRETVKTMETRIEEMEEQIKELEVKNTTLENKFKGEAGKHANVELGKIVVSAAAPAASVTASSKATAKKEGKALVVNKENNFAIINLGNKDGIAIGDVFSVYHDNKIVGGLKVEKVHDSMSAAGFLEAELKDKIIEGDKVVLKR